MNNEQARILRQMEALVGRYEELSIRVTLPEVISDGALFQQLMREHADTADMAAFALEYRKLADEIEQATAMLDSPDMAEMAKEEL